MLPVLILGCLTLDIVLLAVVPGGPGLLLAMVWAAVTMGLLRWCVFAILRRASLRATPRESTVLVRTVEGLMVLLTAAALTISILLWEIPVVWVFFPLPLFGLSGAVKADAAR